MAGFVVLMMLMVTVFYNDLSGIGCGRTPDAVEQLARLRLRPTSIVASPR